MQIDEMKTAPPSVLKPDGKPVNAALEQAIKEAFLGAMTENASTYGKKPTEDQPVHDLHARVKRKKK